MTLRLLPLLAALAASNLAAAHAGAAVLNFDDLDAKGKLSTIGAYNPYGGFTFDRNWYLGDTTVGGYANAAHSGGNFVNNGFGVNRLSVTSANAFDFAGAWFAAPAINGTQATSVNIMGYDALGALVGSTGDVAITNSFAFVAANFIGVTRLVISRDKGFFVMDDFTVADAAQVPEPAGLFALGLGLVGWMARRPRRRA
ncbi:PEP-CTERM sorting domain-containing protein [Massilia forsythiae]|uniref:PEP-CTERM sorting domain-containing protein n=1 Tax=Massilia forsythiae TaxID=2728020 RepID=A0A7Z2VZN8_9BURK|nr:PEP-CTERM sorting domain-containing protein [Massilia forsythiae]QJE02070.1 PEP-CTERM sorting domain-containing protein [Massilia forsythiae]